MFPCGREFRFRQVSEDEELNVVGERESPGEGEGDEECRSEECGFFRVEPSEHSCRVDEPGGEAREGFENRQRGTVRRGK